MIFTMTVPYGRNARFGSQTEELTLSTTIDPRDSPAAAVRVRQSGSEVAYAGSGRNPDAAMTAKVSTPDSRMAAIFLLRRSDRQ